MFIFADLFITLEGAVVDVTRCAEKAIAAAKAASQGFKKVVIENYNGDVFAWVFDGQVIECFDSALNNTPLPFFIEEA